MSAHPPGQRAAPSKAHRKPSREIQYRLADNLKRLRKARNYTQQELANRCRLTKSYISNVEQGTVNISLANLENLARGLRCSEVDLLLPRGGNQP